MAANSRISRLFMEVVPPKFVPIIRYRASKPLDTIVEEEKDIHASDNGNRSSLSFKGRARDRDRAHGSVVHALAMAGPTPP
ncbi:hypothetical protein C5167_038875 [Papaver somniferum]|uniref:Uncharacterized protein n=1 Tax=Papaver somniferum TaxID=3469 RepID=A0A4Y7IEV3_PAPSO|nr:hypothetical protein C5167_038875 [Papaver somniferum]